MMVESLLFLTMPSDYSPQVQPVLRLAHGLRFEDLYQTAGLRRLDQHFLTHLQSADGSLAALLAAARRDPAALAPKESSELLIALAPHLEDFIGDLFGIQTALHALHARHQATTPMVAAKRKFVLKRAVSGCKPEQAAQIDGAAARTRLESALGAPFTEALFAAKLAQWLEDEPGHASQIEAAMEYSRWAVLTPAGQAAHHSGILFRATKKLDPLHLIQIESITNGGVSSYVLGDHHYRHREGFALTDAGMDLLPVMDHATYCIKCHHQGKDSCSTGLKEKDGTFKKSALGITLAGCPLDEKISEMNIVKLDGYTVGALAITTVDNPMCAGTGHRICNDCMKACIFQKQEPVDIPQIETRSLKDTLDLPWGFEIYSLLTRWNPLNLERPYPALPTGKKVLVVGLGPAGFTLSHHLLNDGHTVVAIDGLKIEPLRETMSGKTPLGDCVPFEPTYDVNQLREPLDDRVMAGFGGVAEYGITVRWDKNFLKMIRLLLERRNEFSMFGGLRFGGTMTAEQAFDAGFDHIALAMGAGRPTLVPMKNGLARGVRQASDFLMALQLTGAAKSDSLANLQLRMPVVVIGGGLTAVDTATESRTYYLVQIERYLTRYEALVKEKSAAEVEKDWSTEERKTAGEFLTHARAVRAERARATSENREPDLQQLIEAWGGVTLAYRRRLIDAPSYTLNHEEVEKALEEGIRFAENLTPDEVVLDEYGHVKELKCKQDGQIVTLPTRSILVAAGTQPNTVLSREHPDTFIVNGRYFQAVNEQGQPVDPERLAKPSQAHVLLSVRPDGRSMSFFGDLHPSFAGNVVKAMASAKRGYPVVSRTLARYQPSSVPPAQLLADLNRQWRAVVHKVVRLTPTIIEVIVHAPAAARNFLPGQFFRLQNYETLAARCEGTRMAMEGLALTGADVDREKGLVSVIVLEMGGSSDLCRLLQPGEPVILMGPTGTPTETPSGETVMLAGGGLGNAVLFSIGQQLRAQGSRVLYFAGYKKLQDRYKIEEIEAAADAIIWCCDEAPGFPPSRPQDKSTSANIVEAMALYAQGKLGPPSIKLDEVDRIIAIGSDGMMRAVAQARHLTLKDYFRPDHEAIGSINSPMQCMMKEICAQCLQQHKDPKTGVETIVFSCANQDQPLDHVDFAALRQRLSQNSLLEKQTKQWIRRCLAHMEAPASAAAPIQIATLGG